jgi:hypothetical protein
MQVKLTQYSLAGWYGRTIEVKPGMKVCPSNDATSVGTVVDIPEVKEDYYKQIVPKSVAVVWATGKKKGQRTIHPVVNLVDFEGYLEAVKAQYDKLKKLKTEALTFGL